MGKPVREITNRGTSKNTGYFTSSHSGLVKFESHLERDAMFILESDKRIKKFKSQPMKVHYTLDNKKRQYTPDIEVHFKNKKKKSLILEVKIHEKLQENRLKFRAIKNRLNKWGYDYSVITEKFIQQQPRLDNIKLLHRYSEIKVSKKTYEKIEQSFSGKKYFILGHLKEELINKGILVNEFYAAIYRKILIVNIDQKIDFEANIFFNPKGGITSC